jgi:hypothetical protein
MKEQHGAARRGVRRRVAPQRDRVSVRCVPHRVVLHDAGGQFRRCPCGREAIVDAALFVRRMRRGVGRVCRIDRRDERRDFRFEHRVRPSSSR